MKRPVAVHAHPIAPKMLPTRPDTWEGFCARGVRSNVCSPYMDQANTVNMTLERLSDPGHQDELVLEIDLPGLQSQGHRNNGAGFDVTPGVVLLLAEGLRRLVIQARAEGLIPDVDGAFPKSGGSVS